MQMGQFEKFMRNPYWVDTYNKAAPKLQQYYRLSWEYNGKKYPKKVTEEIKRIQDSFSKEDWELLIDQCGNIFAKIYYYKRMKELFPEEV